MRFKRNCKGCSKSFRPSGKNVVVCNVCNPYRKGRKMKRKFIDVVRGLKRKNG